VIERATASMFHWARIVGQASDGAHLVERDGVLAPVVPAAPERSVINSVVYRDADALAAAYDDVAAAYAAIGAQWTVWVQPGDERAAKLLEQRGHRLDAEPAAMARELAPGAVERPAPEALPDWTADGDIATVGALNDRSYPFGTDSFSRAVTRVPDGAVHIYVAAADGEPAGCLGTIDHRGNTEIQMVAVVPEARGSGIAGKLLAHALADAAERGSTSSTLVATRLGYPVYERCGFRPFGRFHMWERAPGGGAG